MSDFDNINNKNSNLINYYFGLNHLIHIYLNNLSQNIDNKDLKSDITLNLEELEQINGFLKQLKNIKINKDSINLNVILLTLYNNINNINNLILNLIKFIKKINIFNEKTLISDTSKNNINNNKIVLLDSYNKIELKCKNRLNSIITFYKDNIILNKENYIILHNFYLKNNKVLNLYINAVKHYLNNDIKKGLKQLIIYNNIINKNNIIINNLKNSSIDKHNKKYLSNNLNQFYYLFYKNNSGIVTKYNNIVNKFNFYVSNSTNKKLNGLFLQNLSINTYSKLITDILNNKTLSHIQKIVNDLYKLDMEHINITIVETHIDNINYNVKTLLDSNYKLNKDIGINNDYINKTKTIITNDNTDIGNDNNSEFYLDGFNKIYNINNFNYALKKNNDYDEILLNSNYILINKVYYNQKNYEFHILKHVNANNIYMNFEQIRLLLQKSPDYYIENYNIYKNKILIKYVNNDNIFNLYNSKISNDYKNKKQIDNLELKNNIINKIKKEKMEFTNQLKNKNINKLIQIIIDELFIYIQNNNNIDFTPELIITYYSNVNSMILKVKKELNDNYTINLIENIENIINYIYSNIITINYNILDKYYLTQL
jgi:hypothetical protein